MFIKSLCAELDGILRRMSLPSVSDPIKDTTSTSDPIDYAEYKFLILFAAEHFSLSSDIIGAPKYPVIPQCEHISASDSHRSLKFHVFATDQICH